MEASTHSFKYFIATSVHKGVTFYDMDPLLMCPAIRKRAIQHIAKAVTTFSPTIILGVESRGFGLAAHLADEMGLGWLMARKAGKTPGEVVQVEYSVEYGDKRVLELKERLFSVTDRVLIVDDVLATGGTAAAMAELVQKAGGTVAGLSFLIDIDGLGGIGKCAPHPVHSLVSLKLGEVTPRLPEIYVGTTNSGKLAAVQSAAKRMGFDKTRVNGIDVESCVPNQPFGQAETYEGAKHRAYGAIRRIAMHEPSDSEPIRVSVLEVDAIGIGIENGIVHDECEHMGESWETYGDVAIVVATGSDGIISSSQSCCAVIPPKYHDLVMQSISDPSVTFGKRLAATDRTIAHDNWHTALGARDRYETISAGVEEVLLKYLGFN